MKPVVVFFQNLEEKCCSVCGGSMTEQAESYMTECFHCHEEIMSKEFESV